MSQFRYSVSLLSFIVGRWVKRKNGKLYINNLCYLADIGQREEFLALFERFDKFKFDEEEVVVKQCLKLVVKGKKVYKGLSDIIFDINNEIKNNNIDNKYSDIKYNKYIENFCNLIERNNVDI